MWAAEEYGDFWHRDGRGWSAVHPADPDARDVRSGWVFAAADAWVANWISGPGHWNGTTWTEVPTGAPVFLNALAGAPDGTLWGLGNNGAILRHRR